MCGLPTYTPDQTSSGSRLSNVRDSAHDLPPKERIFHLAEISAPRIGSASKEDEPWAFECREFLRQFAVGKPITFTKTHSLPPKDGIESDFGHAEIGGKDVATEVLRAGFARCKELKREPTEDDNRRKDIEAEAHNSMVGMWNPQGPKASKLTRERAVLGFGVRTQERMILHRITTSSTLCRPTLRLLSRIAIVEQVRDGSTLRVRLLMPEDQHQFANISLAGVRCPRAGGRDGETAEEFGEESVRSRRFVRNCYDRVMTPMFLASLATRGPSSNSLSPGPHVHTFCFDIKQRTCSYGNVLHPNGNIAEFLLAAGLARVIDWHAGMLAANGVMERLRGAEKYIVP
ncbi:transcription factor [Rhizoctonia solani AG-1 IA]|uniref:Transcription factor n=1 Tax=Thanatephorus cucumeris (strain AG1-IA) TaxID=983506 RepID=L8X1G0_THACA|nr:transcription factor [Rhizoctonia solani AG-1 IA]